MEILFEMLLYFICGLFVSSFITYSWVVMQDQKYNWKDTRNIFSIVIIDILMIIAQYLFSKPIKLIAIVIIFIMLNYIMYSKKLKTSIVNVLLTELIIIVAEMIYMMSYFSLENINLKTDFITKYNVFIVNITTGIIAFIIFEINNKYIKKAINILKGNNNKHIIIYCITIFSLAIISTSASYLEWDPIYVVFINIFVILFFVIATISYMKNNEKYNEINKKYQTSISSLKEYETMIDKFRVNNHENKNELLTIRNMIKNKDKKAINYIDTLVDNKIKDNEKIMLQTSKIPEGGLRATIYSKLCVMEKYKIEYKLDIAKDVRTVDLINLDEELILNICKILGVFLDNAIDEVQKLKDKNIIIELYTIDNSLYIDITNNFEGNLDLNKIGKEKVTTKGKNHGYGLLLVNKIINENNKYLENEKRVDSNLFTQTLIIKM
ncbi:MAG: GHKL domain-containing protein [Bacilli bacterium]|nr:GHKL domain-containing protein [Bacilli bacterium]